MEQQKFQLSQYFETKYHKSVSASAMQAYTDSLAYMLVPEIDFNNPQQATFSVSENGYIRFRNHLLMEESYNCTPETEGKARQKWEEFKGQAAKRLANENAKQKLSFPDLFRYCVFRSAEPVYHTKSQDLLYWKLHFGIELTALTVNTTQNSIETGHSFSSLPEEAAKVLKQLQKATLEGENVTAYIGANGYLVGLDYYHLPVESSVNTAILNLKEGLNAVTNLVYQRDGATGLVVPMYLGVEGREQASGMGGTVTSIKELPGIYFYNLDDETKLKTFVSKIKELVPTESTLKYVFNKEVKRAHIYLDEDTMNVTNPIQTIIYNALTKVIKLKNDSKVSFYDTFNGDKYQLINIDHYNNTTQYEYFVYALTHLFREYLWAVELGITEEAVSKNFIKEYEKAHGRTLIQDLEVYSYFAKRKNESWSWWEDLFTKYEYLRAYPILIDRGTKIFRSEEDTNRTPPLYLIEIKGDKATAPVSLSSITFINIESWEKSLTFNNSDENVNTNPITYDEILF